MLKKRMIAVLILRDGQVVQSVRFKHTNVIHYDPVHAMEAFNKWSVDEIVMLNVSPKPSSVVQFIKIVDRISRECFVPLSVGGWITTEEIAARMLASGADKLVLNTAFVKQPDLVRSLSKKYGQQCIVASIDVKRLENGAVKVITDRATQMLDCSGDEWARRCVELGAGEIFFNSVDHDGARRGYDLDGLRAICSSVDVPVIAFGGVMLWKHLGQGFDAGAGAVAAANVYHYKEQATRAAKSFLASKGYNVRSEGQSYGEAK